MKKITNNHIHSWFYPKLVAKGKPNNTLAIAQKYVLRPTEDSGVILILDTAFLVHLQISKYISSKQAQSENSHTFQVNDTQLGITNRT